MVDDLNKEFGVDRAIGTSADLSETEGREALVRCASQIPRPRKDSTIKAGEERARLQHRCC